jgi:hypothetical protein
MGSIVTLPVILVKYIIRSTVPMTEVQSPMEQYDEHAERSHQPARCIDLFIIDFEAFLRGVPSIEHSYAMESDVSARHLGRAWLDAIWSYSPSDLSDRRPLS